MSFRKPKEAEKYFENIVGRNNDTKLSTIFDWYYLCLMVGLSNGHYGDEGRLEGEFVDNYIAEYKHTADIIAGMLICTEMKRQDIKTSDRDSIQKLILNIVDYKSHTRLNKYGMDLLNKYAVRGFDLIREYIPKPETLDVFMIIYFDRFRNGQFC